MPGRGSYGPGGRWIHDRAERIMASNPETPKSVAYATATQQAHKVGKSPKGFRTAQGMRTAKAKFSLPKKEYRKTASAPPPHPFEFTLRGMLIKEALGKKRLQQAQQRKRQITAKPKRSYESPTAYVRRLWAEKGGKDPGDPVRSAREKAQAAGIKQPYTARQRAAGVPPPPKAKPGSRVEKKPPQRKAVPPKQQAPKTAPTPKASTKAGVKKVTQQVSKLRRYGLPIGLGLAGAAAIGGAAYLASRKKKAHESNIEKFWKGKKKTAMLSSFMDELEKISQAPQGGSLADRAQKGAPGAWGSLGGGAAAGGSGGGGGEAAPSMPTAPTTPPAPGGGGGGGMSLDMPTADPFGGKGPPGGGNPMGGGMGGAPLGGGLGGGGDSMGGMGGGDPAGGAGLGSKNAPPAPPPPKPSGLRNPLRNGGGSEGPMGE